MQAARTLASLSRLESGRGTPVSSLDGSTEVKEQLYQSQLWDPVNLGRLLLLAHYTEEETEAQRQSGWLLPHRRCTALGDWIHFVSCNFIL